VGRRSWVQQLHIQEARCRRWKSRCEKLQQVCIKSLLRVFNCKLFRILTLIAFEFHLPVFWQRLDFLQSTFDDLERDRQRRRKESLKSVKYLTELKAEKTGLRTMLLELEAKRELQQQLFDKFMDTTKAQLDLQLAEIETIESLAAASSSDLIVRSLEIVDPIKMILAQSVSELIYEMCAHYSSFTQDSTRNVCVQPPSAKDTHTPCHYACAAEHFIPSHLFTCLNCANTLCMSVLLSKQPETFEGYIQVNIPRPVKKRWCRCFCRQRPVACCIARNLRCLYFAPCHERH
jgi:hypothetical protein